MEISDLTHLPWWKGLVDDAGLFPPEELSMTEAVARHRRNLASAGTPGGEVLSHRFLCPVSQLPDLIACTERGDVFRTILLGTLDPAVVERIDMTIATVDVAGWETKLEPTTGGALARFRASEVARRVVVSVEVPMGARLEDNLDLVSSWGVQAKVRCGGLNAAAFPLPEELADFIVGCVRRSLPFKATAGLHHPLSRRDAATGFDHFGFVNLLAATAQARIGAETHEVAATLVRRELPSTIDAWTAARESFRSFGSCSTSEPVQDLLDLGLLAGSL